MLNSITQPPPKLKLTYFDFEGRGEPARLIMTMGQLEFEDERIAIDHWQQHKPSMPLGVVPVLTVDDRQVTQSNSINRYLGKLAGLYPEDTLQALLCDEVMDAVDDVIAKILPSFEMEEAEKKLAREEWLEGPLTQHLTWLDKQLQTAGGRYFADHSLTIADLKVMVWIKSLKTGSVDYIPADCVEQRAPRILTHYRAISRHPALENDNKKIS